MKNQTPNAYVVIALTKTGPEAKGTFASELEAMRVYDLLEHGFISAQVQVSLVSQTTVWSKNK